MTEVRRNGKRTRGNKRDSHRSGSVKNKIMISIRGCGAKQKTFQKFFIRCFAALPHQPFYFFLCPRVAGAIVCPRPEQLVRSTPLLP
jgi:hypothetical protein